MRENKSYVFFREISSDGPLGALGGARRARARYGDECARTGARAAHGRPGPRRQAHRPRRRQRDRARGGRGRLALQRWPVLPGAAQAGDPALRQPAGDGHRGPGRQARRPARRRRRDPHAAGDLCAGPGTPRGARAHGREERRPGQSGSGAAGGAQHPAREAQPAARPARTVPRSAQPAGRHRDRRADHRGR